MATKKINYKSDFELIYTLTDNEGNPLSVPDNPWELWLSVGNPLGTNVRKFIAKYDGGDYTNCRVQDDTIIVIADNHKLPTGHLWTTFIDYQPNSDFPDGDKRIYTPQPTDVELVSGAGDAPTEEDIRILANYVVYEHSYTAGQGITIEGDVISATGESYTAGAGIDISNGEIGLDTATQTAIASIADKASKDELQNVLDGLTSDIADVAQDVQSVESELQEKADNTEIDRVIAIINNDEHGLPSKADVADVTTLGNRVTAVEGSITDLTVTDPALRQSDKTTSKQIGKVAEFSDSGDHYLNPQTLQPLPSTVPELNVGDIYMDGVFKEGMNNKYALPHADNGVKARADYIIADNADVEQLKTDVQGKADTSDVSALDERVVVVETALPTKASTSSVNAIDGRVTTLENTYEDTMNIANNQLNELIDGKAMIAEALTDRGYPTQPTDSSASMAQKIENMAYDAGWLAQLGYTEQNDGGVKEAVAYSKAIKDGWNPAETSRRFTADPLLTYFPVVDTSQFTSFASMFKNCKLLSAVPNLNVEEVTSMESAFEACTAIREIPVLNTAKVSVMRDMFKNATNVIKIKGLDFSSWTDGSYMFLSTILIQYMILRNIGKVQNVITFGTAGISSLRHWGEGDETNRQSLVNTLLTYSYDRATANYSTCTVKLHANTLARLTNEEIAAITAKGFTLTS